MANDPLADWKLQQRTTWASFTPMAVFTLPVSAHLVRFAGIQAGEAVLDVGTGTGIVALTAARVGARVTALDLTPELLTQARENARIARHDEIVWTEGDAEELPYPDASFDVVLSQFGHMFAPRPARVVAEMRRVLKPQGRIAFATWPPEHMIGRMFAFMGRHAPPLPEGAAPPPQWGHPATIIERLGGVFHPPFFARGAMALPALSIPHYRLFLEQTIGPMQKIVAKLSGTPDQLEQFRSDFEVMAADYFVDNHVHQDYLLTRAQAR